MKTMQELFNEKLSRIYQRALDADISVSLICKKSGVSRATPDRWRKSPPLSIALIDKMEEVLIAEEKEQKRNK